MASPTQQTWVWANSGRWWRTGKPGMLQSIVAKRTWLRDQTRSHVQLFCDPMDCSPPNSSKHGISQAGFPRQDFPLEWVAIPFSRGSSRLRDWTCAFCTAGRSFTSEPPGKPWLLNGGSFLGLCFPLANYLALTPRLVWLMALPCVSVYLSAKMDSSMKVSGRLTGHIMGYCPLLWGPFLCMYSLGDCLDPKNEECATSLLRQGSALLCSCHHCYLSVHRRLNPAAYPVPVIILVSKHKQEASCKCLTQGPSIFCLRMINSDLTSFKILIFPRAENVLCPTQPSVDPIMYAAFWIQLNWKSTNIKIMWKKSGNG